MATMSVSRSKEFAGLVEVPAASGADASAGEVVRDGLKRLRREQPAHDEKTEIPRREIGIGVEQARQRRFSKQSAADICAEIDT